MTPVKPGGTAGSAPAPVGPPLACQREAFTIPPEVTWLNSAYMGPLPRATQEAGLAAIARRAVPTGLAAADFFEPAERVRALCATLIGADGERIALVPTTAAAIALAAHHLAPAAGRSVVLPAGQFPSNVFRWRKLQARGVVMRTVAAPTAAEVRTAGVSVATLWTQRLLEAIDARCAVVAIEPAHWTDGSLFDLVAIGERARAVGAALVVDATQSVGAMPVDVGRIQPDLLVAHAYKSMLSHYGLGFAWLGERFDDAEPREESWLLRQGADNFARLLDYQDAYAPGMRRFDTSTRANPVLIASLEASARLLVDWQPVRIADHCRRITTGFRDAVRAAGYGMADADAHAPNLFGLTPPAGVDLDGLRGRLADAQVHVSIRGDALRVSPHVYNDEGDLDRLLALLRRA